MEQLLKLLSDGDFHSGEEIGVSLGVSRAAVWKKIKYLEQLGLQIDSVRGRGYRLAPGLELLDEERVCGALEPVVSTGVAYHHCLTTTSTNDWVQEIVSQTSDGDMHFCTAEHQTKGRGRRGRVWLTPFGSTISLSVLWRVGGGTASLEGLSLAVGVAVLKALEACGAAGLGLKWPNDILWQGRKLCGILLEAHGDPTGDCDVIIGIGINMQLSKMQCEEITQPVVDLNTICSRPISRNQVVSALINGLYHMLDEYRDKGFEVFRDEWSAFDLFAGKRVTLDVSGSKVVGVVLGVNEQGGLILETAEGRHVFHGGEVSLRKCEETSADES